MQKSEKEKLTLAYCDAIISISLYINKRYKIFLKNSLKNIIKGKDSENIEELVANQKEKTKDFVYINNQIKDLKKNVSVFLQLKYVDDITIIYYLLELCMGIHKLKDNEIIWLLNLIIKNNASLLLSKPNLYSAILKDKDKKLAESYITLSRYITDCGTFIDDVDTLLVKKTFKNIFDIGEGEKIFEKYTYRQTDFLTPEKCLKSVLNLSKQEKKIESSITPKKQTNNNVMINQNDVDKLKQEYKKSIIDEKSRKKSLIALSNYYLDGEVINLPNNIDEFNQLLVDSGFELEKREKILKKMQTFIIKKEKESLYKKYLNDQEYVLYENALRNIENDNIAFFVGEIDSAIVLCEEQENNNDLLVYIKECLSKIAEIIKLTKHYS